MSVLTKDNALELLQSPQGLFPSSGVLMVFVLFNKIDEEPNRWFCVNLVEAKQKLKFWGDFNLL